MCGIVMMGGFVGAKEERMLRMLLVLDSVRGEDSTGIAAIPKQGDVIVAKELGDPFTLFPSRKYVAAMRQANRAIIGHNRFATSGGVSKSTAHPFDFDTLVGVHNGTLRNKYKLDDAQDFVVDSENLYHHIEKNGLKHALNVVDGAYALVWWDKGNETMNILRNKERPLFMASSEDKKTLFCASESWMLTIAASRNDIKLAEIIPVVEDMHYAFPINNQGAIEKPKVKHMPSTFVPIVYSNNGTWNNQTVFPKPNIRRVSAPVLKLIPPPEKKTTSGTDISIGLTGYRVGQKNIQLEVVGKQTDKNGSVYVALMDSNWPAAPIRLYPHKKDPRTYAVGRELIGEISYFVAADGFFKISPHNILLLPEKKVDLYKYDDGKGHKLTKKEWEEKYPNCDWCFDPLFAEDHGNRLNNTGGCFCGKCVSNPEAIEYQTLKAVY